MDDHKGRAPLSEATFYVLLSLAAGPKHGYALLKEAERLSERRLALSVSTLYTTLARLEEQGWIERLEDGNPPPAPGLPRKVYRLSGQGQAALQAEARRLRGLLASYELQMGAQGR